jgi:uncharacterized membrane protein
MKFIFFGQLLALEFRNFLIHIFYMEALTAPAQRLAIPLTKQRITSIDFLRGLVMVIMALDHVRDYFHIEGMTGDPTDLATTSPLLFFTRWITHFCAPTFLFLSGVSAFLSGQRRTKKELSIFLLTRGLWLILLELTIISFAWTFDPLYHTFIMQVIWAIGISMIILSAVIWLPLPAIMFIGFAVLLGHNFLDKPELIDKNQEGVVWSILHTPGGHYVLPLDQTHSILFFYGFLSWTGIMILGYCFGNFYKKKITREKRKKILLTIGLTAIALFIVLRFIDDYGDRAPWSTQKNAVFTIMSFLNVTKYPPSLMYTLMTLGPSILFLAYFENMGSRVSKFFITFGRVPFFYYLLHLFLIHTLTLIAFYASGYGANDIVSQPFYFRPLQFGFSLWAVYGIWASVVLLLYPLCKWYDRYKSTHSHWALSYL